MSLQILFLFLGLTIGNFIYGYFADEIVMAVDRSFFQGLALLLVVILII